MKTYFSIFFSKKESKDILVKLINIVYFEILIFLNLYRKKILNINYYKIKEVNNSKDTLQYLYQTYCLSITYLDSFKSVNIIHLLK